VNQYVVLKDHDVVEIENIGQEFRYNKSLSKYPTKIKFISIEGNIAAGKTTLIRGLKEKYKNRDDILFLEEPVDIWNTIKDKNGKTILQYFYKDLAKYAFAFQVMAYTTRLQLIKETIANASPKVKVVVMERSLEADANIFAKMLHEEGIMNTIEHQVYSLMTKNNLEDYGVDGIIWLHTEPDECYSRVRIRNREGEEGIDLGYLRKCHQYHLEWLGANLGFVCNIGEGGEGDSLESDLEKIHNYLF
jgi:deoxyadenosine/deoxycytidine kinase